jgi:hypothetical protein
VEAGLGRQLGKGDAAAYGYCRSHSRYFWACAWLKSGGTFRWPLTRLPGLRRRYRFQARM